MDHGIEEPLAPALGTLTVARILGDVGDQTRMEDALPIVRRIKAAIQIEIGPSEVQPTLFGHLFQCLQAFREQHHIWCMDGRHGDGSEDIPRVVKNGEDFVAFLVFMARVAHAIAPFLAPVLVPAPWSTRRSSCFSTARCRTLATHACQSEPSSAHLAKTL